MTSRCLARCGAISLPFPVRTFTTPPGRSLVARHSQKTIAVRGSASPAIATTTFPVVTTGRIVETRPSSTGRSGATTATIPIGSGTLKPKCGPLTGFEDATSAWYLSQKPA